MRFRVFLIAALVLIPATAQAKHRHHSHRNAHTAFISTQAASYTDKTDPRYSAIIMPMGRGHLRESVISRGYDMAEHVIGGRPAGGPHAYCGCGAALYVFGVNRRDLWPASAWFRFPSAAPGPGMAAVRNHHVAIIIGGSAGAWLLHDSNSGGGLTREHVRDLRGYRIVDPHGGRYASRD